MRDLESDDVCLDILRPRFPVFRVRTWERRGRCNKKRSSARTRRRVNVRKEKYRWCVVAHFEISMRMVSRQRGVLSGRDRFQIRGRVVRRASGISLPLWQKVVRSIGRVKIRVTMKFPRDAICGISRRKCLLRRFTPLKKYNPSDVQNWSVILITCQFSYRNSRWICKEKILQFSNVTSI